MRPRVLLHVTSAMWRFGTPNFKDKVCLFPHVIGLTDIFKYLLSLNHNLEYDLSNLACFFFCIKEVLRCEFVCSLNFGNFFDEFHIIFFQKLSAKQDLNLRGCSESKGAYESGSKNKLFNSASFFKKKMLMRVTDVRKK